MSDILNARFLEKEVVGQHLQPRLGGLVTDLSRNVGHRHNLVAQVPAGETCSEQSQAGSSRLSRCLVGQSASQMGLPT